RRTPVELVAEWQHIEQPQAAEWLEKALASEDSPPPPPEPPPPDSEATDADVEITRLAKLSVLEYEQQRKDAAERLGGRASILHRLVQAERERLGLGDADDGKQGHAISFPEPEPWPEPVNGAALLNALAATIRRHVVMSATSSHAAALWIMHAWLIDYFVVSPRLCVRSVMKG